MASAGNPKDDTGLERKMESRHLTMISLGGVIGTGLFVSSGYTIHQAGPLGAILAYAVGSLLVYCVMVSLGELSVAMPYAGSFHMYAKRFIGPGTAFTIAILYWLNWAVALASEFTAARLLLPAAGGVHGGRAVDATMVSSFAVLGVVGRVHCGGVRAQHHVRAAIW